MTYGHFDAWRRRPIEDRPLLSIVIPTFNEEVRILPTIGAISAHVSSLGFDWEMIVSDDGSTDGTVELVESLGLANLRLVRTPVNRGKGHAVRVGVLASRGDLVLFSDADYSTPISELASLMAAIEGGHEVAVGSRAGAGAEVNNRSSMRGLTSRGLRAVSSVTLTPGVRDTQCGFKLFTGESAKQLFKLQRLDGFAFDLEVLFLASVLGMRVAEVPVHWYDAPMSKVDPIRESLRFLRDVARIRWLQATGAYRPQAAPVTTVAERAAQSGV